jgi:hypothetical protein
LIWATGSSLLSFFIYKKFSSVLLNFYFPFSKISAHSKIQGIMKCPLLIKVSIISFISYPYIFNLIIENHKVT